MNIKRLLKNGFLVLLASLVLTACAVEKKSTGLTQGDVYTGNDSVEYLASGVKDRVFFATNIKKPFLKILLKFIFAP